MRSFSSRRASDTNKSGGIHGMSRWQSAEILRYCMLVSPLQAVAAPSAPAGSGGITRDQFIERAKDRAAQHAGARFDQMDTDHDGVLDRAEIRTWRTQHPRRAGAQPSQPTPQ